MAKIGFSLFFLVVYRASFALELNNRAYDGFVIKVSEDVPVKDCRVVLENLEATLTSASQYLFSSLDSRAFIRSATVLLPSEWPDTCAPSTIFSGAGETSDMTVFPQGPIRGRLYTQQSLGCGEQGDQIYLAHEALTQRDPTLARSLVKEFAMYRFGVFEEQGYHNDPIYPICFYDDQTQKGRATGCSDLPITDNGICTSPEAVYNTTKMVDSRARSSIIFAPEAPQISMFCDDGNHDRWAPTKQNSMCQQRSVLDVILKHKDFYSDTILNNLNSNQLVDTTPKVTYKKQNLTRYVFVLDNTKDMMQRESWSYLRLALRFWALYVLPPNTEIGVVLAEGGSKKVLNIVPTSKESNRDKFYSSIPYTPGDSLEPGCLHCALNEVTEMMTERNEANGAANNVIVVIAAGLTPSEQLSKALDQVKKSKIKIVTINYPSLLRSNLLNSLAEETGGVSYTVFEKKLNIDTTLLSTYFELTNVLFDIVQRFYSGSVSNLPLEIYRREIIDDGRSSISGSFMLDPNLSRPSQFTLFTHNSVTPLIKSLKLISPSHHEYSERSDRFIDFKRISLTEDISEAGTWSYIVEPYSGNPQPHYLQVTATPVSPRAPIVRARFWTHKVQNKGPIILLVEVKRGELPILDAKVQVSVVKPEVNGTYAKRNFTLELLDTGAGDPDITKGDGVYTRYFSASETGPGLYDFEVTITDNGNAYTYTDSTGFEENKPCCGSSIPPPGKSPLSPFQRVLPKITLMISSEDITAADQVSTGRIGDLKAHIIPKNLKARLSWTSPDMGGHVVSRYEIKYATTVQDVTERFETAALRWDNGLPFPLEPGSETTFTIDLSQNKELLDKPLYFVIKPTARDGEISGPISNWVRVLVPSPPPPPTMVPSYTSNEPFWPLNNLNSGVDAVGPSLQKSKMGLELILPIAIGFILLVILLILYCYFCVVKRRTHGSTPKKGAAIKNDKLSSTITIVPSTPQTMVQNQNNYSSEIIPDPHQVGVPIPYEYEEDPKKRYSLVNQQEQQLIEELKQQQLVHHQRDLGNTNNAYSGLSVISTNTLNRNGHPLSPFNSWSASQLLHEHERRNSPLENDQIDPHQELLASEHLDAYQNQHHIPPPIPPLPAFSPNGYPINYNIYGVHPNGQNHPIYQSMQRNETLVPFNPSLQGSLSSVNSGDKKRRNVTMV